MSDQERGSVERGGTDWVALVDKYFDENPLAVLALGASLAEPTVETGSGGVQASVSVAMMLPVTADRLIGAELIDAATEIEKAVTEDVDKTPDS